MKLKFLFLMIFVIIFSSLTFAQSVTITSKKVTFKRPKPIADYKKSFTVNYPKVKAATPALSKKIEESISYKKVLGVNIEEEKTEIQWLETADYEITYNKNGILCVSLFAEGSAAYPSTNVKTVVVNTKTGAIIKPADALINLKGLAAKLKKMQTAEIAAAKKEIKENPEEAETNVDELFENADFTVANIDEYSVDEKGVTFKYDYDFAHVIQALQPNGTYSMTWAELEPYIKKGSIFEKFVK
jgi:hypothetical protein